MTAGQAADDAPAPVPMTLMTMSVTRIRDGQVIEQRTEVRIRSDLPLSPHDLSSAWPPCECPRHR